MLLESLILSIAFIVCVCVLIKIGREDDFSPSFSTNDNIVKQPEIHIHNNNNSHGGYSSSNSTSDSNSENDNIDTTNSTTTDNVSEDMVKRELDQIRNELERKQQLDMEILEQLNKLDKLINK